MLTPTFCRLCERACGLLAEVEGGALRALTADPSDPVCGGAAPCAVAAASVGALRDPRRPVLPQKRVGGALVPVPWDQALRELGDALRALRAAHGPDAIGLVLGEGLVRAPLAFGRALAFGVGSGSRHIFSELMDLVGPRLRATEAMLGHPALLLSDLGRAHYVVLVGAEGPEAGWGPGQAGGKALDELRHSRKTKGTKVIVADAQKGPLCADADQHLPLRPGSEPFFILGLLSAAVAGGYRDKQFVRDYSEGWDALVEALAPWSVERCAELCGLAPAALAGVALKFHRSPMSVLHPGWSALTGPHADLGAWAWLCLHAITANALRPGGLYDHRGIIDLHVALSLLPQAEAPKVAGLDAPLLALQAPAAGLGAALRAGQGSRPRALICVEADPAGRLGPADQAALDGLELLVALARAPSATLDRADWVLPVAHPWEREDVDLIASAISPLDLLRRAPALVAPAGEARLTEDVLRDLFAALHPGVRGSSFGLPLTLTGRALAAADLSAWQGRLIALATDAGPEALAAAPHRLEAGASDRSLWRVSHPSGKIQLLPSFARAALAGAAGAAPPAPGPLLRLSVRAGSGPDALHQPDADADAPAPRARLHPAQGWAEGQRLRLRTSAGVLVVRAALDPSLREDTVQLSIARWPAAAALLPPAAAGAQALDGLAVQISAD
jgi:anaerobic selenocysteine-containing dehydrogenase